MKDDKIGPKIHEPSDEEINETISLVKDRYDIFITKEDAAKLSKLYQEIEWWFMVEKFAGTKKKMDEDISKEIQDYIKSHRGESVNLIEAGKESQESLDFAIPHEKRRLAKVIKKIIDKYK
jgi:hypothetical protein